MIYRFWVLAKSYRISLVYLGIGSTISGLLQVLGYDKQQMSSLGVDMVMYLGELAANTILDTEDNNINTELEEYTTKGDRNNVFSMIKVPSKILALYKMLYVSF